MTKEEILEYFKNINHAYNNAYMYDTLKSMLDELTEPCEDCISRAELLKAVDTWDKFGCDADTKLVPIKDCYVPYIHYDDVVKAIKGMPSIQTKTDVLDKIRAEIEQEYNRLSATRADETLEVGECLGLKMSLKIIDKYKAEKE